MTRIVLLALLIYPAVTLSAPSSATIDRLAADVQPQVVEWRRWFHANPELSNREFKTAGHLSEILTDMGIEHRTGIAKTGLVGFIEGGKPGPLVAIRTDMDGLPVTEETGLPFASKVRSQFNGQDVGVMHACGHDAHMAMVLGAARVLNAIRDDLAGSVMLIFQPAEEGPPEGEEGGALLMLDEGIWAERKPEAIFGIHVGISQPGGRIAVRAGPLMAAPDRFKLVVKGKQTHGAQPWHGVDPIVVAAQIVMGLQTIESRQVDVTRAPSIVSVGRISAGIRFNVIPDELEMEGTIRSFDPAMREDIHARVERTARLIAESAGAGIDLEITLGSPPVVNDPDLVARMMPTLRRVAGNNPVMDVQPQTVGEDFSEYATRIPGMFMFIGSGAPGVDPSTLPTNHSPLFDMHEPSLELGVRTFSHLVVDYLHE